MAACVEYIPFHEQLGSLVIAIDLPTKYLLAPPRAGFCSINRGGRHNPGYGNKAIPLALHRPTTPAHQS